MPIFRYWTRAEQLAALEYALTSYREAADCFIAYLDEDPPPATAAAAARMLKACYEERDNILDAMIALRQGGSTIIFRFGVIRLLKSLNVVALSMQQLAIADAMETGHATPEQKKIMSMMDI
jgi:HEAT repeat protein